jgi:hypothetical protein
MSNATQGNLIAFNAGKVSPINSGSINQTLLMASTASGLLPTFGSNILNQFQRQGGNASVYPSGGTTAYVENDVFAFSLNLPCNRSNGAYFCHSLCYRTVRN